MLVYIEGQFSLPWKKSEFSRLLACNEESAAPVLWSKAHSAEHIALGAIISNERRLMLWKLDLGNVCINENADGLSRWGATEKAIRKY